MRNSHSKIIRRLLFGTLRTLMPVGALLILLAPTVPAAEYYAIIDNFGKRARSAQLDIAFDTSVGNLEAIFHVFNSEGTQLTAFTLGSNGRGYISTESFGNLFSLSDGRPVLIRARTPDAGPFGVAVLNIDSQGAPMLIGVPATQRKSDGGGLSAGRFFSIPLRSFQSAYLLVANVGGNDAAADVFVGTQGAVGNGIFSNPRISPNAVWKVSLTQNEALANLVVASTSNIVVEVVIDDGRTVQSFMTLPNL
jgi:hypothetical protein